MVRLDGLAAGSIISTLFPSIPNLIILIPPVESTQKAATRAVRQSPTAIDSSRDVDAGEYALLWLFWARQHDG